MSLQKSRFSLTIEQLWNSVNKRPELYYRLLKNKPLALYESRENSIKGLHPAKGFLIEIQNKEFNTMVYPWFLK
ncbi:MAG: hypothetical protein JXR70_07385 [Spirochaetales bacterium]|nr:hypothetical protein [Spirochaetales bacterium]